MIEKPFKHGADFEHLRKVLMRETTKGPVPIIELFVDVDVMAEITGMDIPVDKATEFIRNFGWSNDPEVVLAGSRIMDLSLAFSQAMGYDYVTLTLLMPLPRTQSQLKENPQQGGKIRAWQNEHRGIITTRKEFEEFPWPAIDQIDVFPLEYAASKMPPGMKVVSFWTGIFEDLKLIMGIENMAIKSIKEPDLLNDILEILTVLAEAGVGMAAAHPATGAVLYADDMGFKTGTMLSPKFMREYVIPRHKRIADACHKHDKPFIFHSCGHVDALMKDLIEVVGIDARHSFQDNIEPVENVYRKYHDRISIVGGVDVDLLARATPAQVRARTRQILEACAPGGGFCMGTGNSVTNYCKIENYYAMLDETRKWNEEHG